MTHAHQKSHKRSCLLGIQIPTTIILQVRMLHLISNIENENVSLNLIQQLKFSFDCQCSKHTSHTMQQSWFTPFWPFFEKTEAKLLEPSTFTEPEVRKIKSFFFASFAIASAASLPLHLPEFLPFLNANDLASPLNMEDKCPIS